MSSVAQRLEQYAAPLVREYLYLYGCAPAERPWDRLTSEWTVITQDEPDLRGNYVLFVATFWAALERVQNCDGSGTVDLGYRVEDCAACRGGGVLI